ncbi:MAG: class I SAM-dependent methyltransferase [Actinomycetes bacterium]
MHAAEWDARYAERELVWSAEPNLFIVEQTEDLNPGSALDLACGEGRNAIWLATRGWRVTGVDFSAVALDKARVLAEHAGVDLTLQREDLSAWSPPSASADLVVITYVHLPSESMAHLFAGAIGALAPGGVLVAVGHDRDNLTRGVGGPQDPHILWTLTAAQEWIRHGAEAAAVEVTLPRAEQVVRQVSDPDGTRTAIDTLLRVVRR